MAPMHEAASNARIDPAALMVAIAEALFKMSDKPAHDTRSPLLGENGAMRVAAAL